MFSGVILGWLPTSVAARCCSPRLVDDGLFNTQRLGSPLIMPPLPLALFQLTLITCGWFGRKCLVLRADYIKFARARGLPIGLSIWPRSENTMVPGDYDHGPQIGSIIALPLSPGNSFPNGRVWGSFSSRLLSRSIFLSWFVTLCWIHFFFVVINLIVDILYYVVDPRLRTERVASAHG